MARFRAHVAAIVNTPVALRCVLPGQAGRCARPTDGSRGAERDRAAVETAVGLHCAELAVADCTPGVEIQLELRELATLELLRFMRPARRPAGLNGRILENGSVRLRCHCSADRCANHQADAGEH